MVVRPGTGLRTYFLDLISVGTEAVILSMVAVHPVFHLEALERQTPSVIILRTLGQDHQALTMTLKLMEV